MPTETFCAQHPKSQLSEKSPRFVEERRAKTAESKKTLPISDEELNPSTKFAKMLITITELLDSSANIEQLKKFLKFICNPHTEECYINFELFQDCHTPGEIIEALHPQYINFMHTHLLREIVSLFRDEQSKTLLQQYEDNFPRKKPLKRMRDPIPDEKTEDCHGSKRIKVTYDGDTNVNTTTIEDVERVQQVIEKSTNIDRIVIVYANQTPGSVIFTFLIPETVVSSFSDLDEDSQRDLADHGILRIEVNELVIDLQSLQGETMTDKLQAETKIETSQAEMIDASQMETKTDASQEVKAFLQQYEHIFPCNKPLKRMRDPVPDEETENCLGGKKIKITCDGDTNINTTCITNVSTYTISGVKRVPLTQDSPIATHCNSEFQKFISKVGISLAESVETDELKEFLQSFGHILYPEAQYIDSKLLKDAESVHQIFTALQPHVINFLNWGVLWKVIDTFDSREISAFQSYTSRFPSDTQLSTLPDPLSEKEISEFKGFQKLRVTCGSDSTTECRLGDIQVVKQAVERATGIDQDFIIYAYWEGGFTTHQFTFLLPKPISGIFGELCKEDLAILAGKGVKRLEVDYDTVADNIQELYKTLPQAVAPVREDNRMRTKNFGLEHFIPENEVEQMSKEELRHLNDLITCISVDKLQKTCSNAFLKEFAKKMRSWKDLAPYLGINEWHLNDLAEMYPGDEDEQKYKALMGWKGIDVNSATYERLIECLLRHGHVDDTKELLLHFQG